MKENKPCHIWQHKSSKNVARTLCSNQLRLSYIHSGAQKLTGENLKVVWVEFSTLS
jgi:hypothetical protein